jgi:DNA-binding NarL/FixJ family response regulator
VVAPATVLDRCVRVALGRRPHPELAGTATTRNDALALASSSRPDVLVLDDDVCGGERRTLVAALAGGAQPARVVVVADFQSKTDVMSTLGAGALACVSRGDAARELAGAVRGVGAGALHLSPEVRHLVVGTASETRAVTPILSAGERAVLTLLAEGKTDRQVSVLLDLGVRTVHRHRASIARKLGVRDTGEMIRRAIRLGVLRR